MVVDTVEDDVALGVSGAAPHEGSSVNAIREAVLPHK
jgi:hypothetical protein